MQRFFSNQKTLIGAIGLTMLGIGNAEAISLFDDNPAGVRPAISNVQADLEVSGFVAQKGRVEDAGKVQNTVSNFPQALPIMTPGQLAVTGEGLDVLDSLILSSGSPLSAQAYRYGDVPNMAVYDGTATRRTDSLEALTPFDLDGEAAKILSAKAATDEYRKASPVPLPAAAWSFLLGLIGILGLKKRNNPPTDAGD